MSKYLVTYTVPAQQRRRVIDAESPELAAKEARLTKPGISEVVVASVDGEDAGDDEKEVYQWCRICGLPIWLTDDSDTYTSDSEADDHFHNACGEQADDGDGEEGDS